MSTGKNAKFNDFIEFYWELILFLAKNPQNLVDRPIFVS